tara:strand:- start:203 stop:562 length:360 start_codon:yes stop_codon:yes gene_type:complete
MFLPRENTFDSWLSNPVDPITQVQERLERLQKCMYNTSPTRYKRMDPHTVTTNTAPTGTQVKNKTTGRDNDGGTSQKTTTTSPNFSPLNARNLDKLPYQKLPIRRTKSLGDLTNINLGL